MTKPTMRMLSLSLLLGVSAIADASPYHAGDKLSVTWHGKPYPATVLRVVDTDHYLIHYDGFSSKWDETVGPSRIVGGDSTPPASSAYSAGDKLSVTWHGKPYPATVLRVVGTDRYLIHFDGYSSKWDETVGPSRIVGGSASSASAPADGAPARGATASAGVDPVKCVLVSVRERDLGEKSTSVEVDWLRGQPYPNKIPPSVSELLCKTQAMNPAIEWAKNNGLCGPNIHYTVQFGRVSSPKSVEGGAICNDRKPLGH